MKISKTLKYLSSLLLVCSSHFAFAQDIQVSNINDLKQLQSKIHAVVQNQQPATVALTSDKTGAWGSGVVVSEKGRILTAAHVVQGADTVTVIFPDGTETIANVLGANRTKDTAMLQISEKGKYPFVALGNSDKLKVGDFLVAMGHAGGHDALRKPPVRFGRLVSTNHKGYFSSDCTLIGGDSGGPIFDIEGNLVGINSSIGRDKNANNHAGISALKEDWKRLEAGEVWGRLTNNLFADEDRPVLGVMILGQTREGVLLGDIRPNSPAENAGVREGDILVKINDRRVRTGKDLVDEVNRHRPGQKVSLIILRGPNEVELEAVLIRQGNLFEQ